MLETPDRIEPCFLESPGEEILDAQAELIEASTKLGSRLHPKTAASLAGVVRLMNTYYSNLIEGHSTHPRDIEQALAERLDGDIRRRNLQLEAVAHVRVQAQIEQRFAEGSLPDPASIDFITWLHREFYRDAPPDLLEITDGTQRFSMVPGEIRHDGMALDVAVGHHLPPSNARVMAFLEYFSQRYHFDALGKSNKIFAMAAAHHRFNYIHPFPDGNGRVSRLMSHAMGLKAGIGAHGLWSVSRGLARGLDSRSDYMTFMQLADTPRQGDLDGRGNLSTKALKQFVGWFLKVCLDQVTYMGSLFDLDALMTHLKRYVDLQTNLKPEAVHILHELVLRGEMSRGDAARVTGLAERTARNVLGDLVKDGIVASDTPKGAVYLRFPVHSVEVLFPKLFPEA